MYEKEKKKVIRPATTIMLCVIVFLAAVLCIMQYAKYQKKVAASERKASLTQNDGDTSGIRQNADDAEQNTEKAVMAGVDLLLMPVDFQEAYQGVLDAVGRESITPERIDASVRRILRVKMAWNA